MKKLLTILLSFILVIGLFNNIQSENNDSITILFTHDMHDNFESYNTEINDHVLERGGYARLYTLIEEERKIDSELLLIDGGDFSMGTLFQSIFTTHIPSLYFMSEMGYDATTLGNHEFDFRASGLAQALYNFNHPNKTDIVSSNVSFDIENKNDSVKQLEEAFDNYPIKDYKIVEKNNKRIGLFGLMGYEADSNAPMAEVKFLDMLEEAKRVVKLLEAENVDMIVALSHSGTDDDPKKSEDEILAKTVPEIDVILSAHSHTSLDEPIIIGNTTIMSAGRYAQNLGKAVFKENGNNWEVVEYNLIPIDNTITKNPKILADIERFKDEVNNNYLNKYDFKYNEVIAKSLFNFTPSTQIGDDHKEEPLGVLIGDSYISSIKKAEGSNYIEVDVAVVPSGVIRDSIVEGDITVSNIFNILPLGVGKDGLSGYPLISVYLTGKELLTAAEVDASIQPILSYAQLYMANMTYTFNPNRIIFNKVTHAALLKDGKEVEINKNQLYRVVADLYTGQMLGVVNDQSKGILSIVPKDKDGNVIENFEDHIIYDQNNNEVKAWSAFAEHLKSLPEDNGKPTIPLTYSTFLGSKVIEDNKSLTSIFTKLNITSIVIIAVAILLLLLIFLLFRFIYKRLFKKTNNKLI